MSKNPAIEGLVYATPDTVSPCKHNQEAVVSPISTYQNKPEATIGTKVVSFTCDLKIASFFQKSQFGR